MTLCRRGRSGFRRTLVRGLVAASGIAAAPFGRWCHSRTSTTLPAIRHKGGPRPGKLDRGGSTLVLALDTLTRVVGHERGCDQAEHRASGDIAGNGIRSLIV